MCIFSSDIAVNSTKVLAGLLPSNRRLLGYQNSVVSKTPNVMMLPIPTNDPIVFHDTSAYSGFMDDIAKRIIAKENEGSRGIPSDTSGFSRAGQYQYKMVAPNDVKSQLEGLEQSLPRWIDQMIEAYSGWNWLFCIIDANAEMKNQPLLIEYNSFITDLYFPAMDVHGDEDVSTHASRDHVFIIADPELMENDTVAYSFQYAGFPHDMRFDGTSLMEWSANGDMFATLVMTGNDRDWDMKLANRFLHKILTINDC